VTAAPLADETLRLDENLELVHVQPEEDSDEHKALLGIEDFLQRSLLLFEKRVWVFQRFPTHSKIFHVSLRETLYKLSQYSKL